MSLRQAILDTLSAARESSTETLPLPFEDEEAAG